MQNLDNRIEVLLPPLGRSLRRNVLAQVAFQHFSHQAVYCTANRCNLLQYAGALGFAFERLLQRRGLTLDAANSGYKRFFVADRMRHGGSVLLANKILGYRIAPKPSHAAHPQ
jgi:hypothetical protein